MSSGVKALRKIQFGPEIDPDTGEPAPGVVVPTNNVWRGQGVLEDQLDQVFPKEDVGIGPGVGRSYIASTGGRITLAPVEETFEQSLYLFEGGCKLVLTGAADGTGSGKIYRFPFWYLPANKPAILTASLEAGDDIQVENMNFAYVDSITLAGKGKEAWMVSADLYGKAVIPGPRYRADTISFTKLTKTIADSANGLGSAKAGFTIRISGSDKNDGIYEVADVEEDGSALTVTEALGDDETAGADVTVEQWFSGGQAGLDLDDVEECLFGKTTLYLADVDGELGDTPISNTLLEATIKFKTGIVGQPSASGSLGFSHLEFKPPEITADLTFLFNASARAERENWRELKPRQMRLVTTGSALETEGDDYAFKTRLIDLAGKWQFKSLGEQDGLDVIQATLKAHYDIVADLFAAVTYVNELATLGPAES